MALLACRPSTPAASEPAQPEAHETIECPEGTRTRGQPPPEGNRVWCETAAGVSHGPFLSWHDNGREKTRGAFREGTAQGEWVTWYDNGQLRSKGHYEAGERVGDWKSFAQDGTPQPIERPDPQRVEPTKTLPAWELHTGIPACDEYISSYSRCIEAKAPESMKTQMRDAMEKTAEAWRQTADGAGRAALEETCREALDAVRQASGGVWGCEF